MKSPKHNIVIINNKETEGRVLTYSVVNVESKMNKEDFKEFNTLKEARLFAKKTR
jgi:hypothetical protein